MSVDAFVDTNVLVYAHDRRAGEKHRVASQLIGSLWESRMGAISTQVLHELAVNLQRKVAEPPSLDMLAELLDDYLTWTVFVNDGASALDALRIQARYRISYWDALIVGAARGVGANRLYSEDLNHGQRYEGVEVKNPFA